MLKLLRYLDKRQRGQALLTLVFVVLQVRLDLTLPDYMATITSLAETPPAPPWARSSSRAAT